MPHIHTNFGEHDHTVSAFVVSTEVEGQPKILLHMHKKLGKLMQFGGHIEVDETPWAALEHELSEESGYRLTQLQVLQPIYAIKDIGPEGKGQVLHPVPFCYYTHRFFQDGSHNHTDLSYLMVADGPPIGLPKIGESTDIRKLSKIEIEQLDESDIIPNVKAIALHALQLVTEENNGYVLVDAVNFSREKP